MEELFEDDIDRRRAGIAFVGQVGEPLLLGNVAAGLFHPFVDLVAEEARGVVRQVPVDRLRVDSSLGNKLLKGLGDRILDDLLIEKFDVLLYGEDRSIQPLLGHVCSPPLKRPVRLFLRPGIHTGV